MLDRSRKIRLFVIGFLIVFLMDMAIIDILHQFIGWLNGILWIVVSMNYVIYVVFKKALINLLASFAARWITAHLAAYVDFYGLPFETVEQYAEVADRTIYRVDKYVKKLEK